ncbi:hypothetical protein [Microcystis aeruginosa]|uniref:hypothetical protein n=1 Tax=Microcystis aeruginosa TaxID=1126 RepID=UPI000568B417|nr:hypothetical protein [Microcystis aeruginosa]
MKDSLHLLRFIEDLLIEEDGQSLSDIQRHIIEELLTNLCGHILTIYRNRDTIDMEQFNLLKW